MNLSKPYFYLNVDISQCKYSIKINDASVLEDYQGPPLSIKIPVNQWIVKGNNSVSMELFPVQDANKISEIPESQCKSNVQLVLNNNDGDDSAAVLLNLEYRSPVNYITTNSDYINTKLVGSYNYEPKKNTLVDNEDGDINLSNINMKNIDIDNHKGIKVSQQVTIDSQLPNWDWQNGDTIINNTKTKSSLLDKYQEIWSLLDDKNISSINKAFTQRNNNLAKAYYKDPTYFKNKLNISQLVSDPSMELVKIYPKYTHLKVFGNGKLATIVSWDWETPILIFNAKDGSSHSAIPVIFSRINGQWKIVN